VLYSASVEIFGPVGLSGERVQCCPKGSLNKVSTSDTQ